jgi:hypothetical protein
LRNTVYGTDFAYRNSRLPRGKIFEANGWIQKSRSEGLHGDDAAWGLSLNSPNATGWRGLAEYRRIEANFDPALGFVNRAGIEDYNLDTGYMKRFGKGSPVRSVLTRIGRTQVNTLDDGNLSSQATTFRMTVDNQTGDNAQLQLINSREFLRQDFTIFRASDGSRSVVIPQGGYEFQEASLAVTANGFRRVSGSATVRGGDYYDGSHVSGTLLVNWSPSRHLNTSVSYSEDHIDLPGGDFTVRLVSARADTVFSSHWSWTNLLQYDNVSQVLGINSRVHWQPRAGRDVYLVFNYGLEDRDQDDNFRATNWDLSLKFSYNLRY